jgi:hypothetical protein
MLFASKVFVQSARNAMLFVAFFLCFAMQDAMKNPDAIR